MTKARRRAEEAIGRVLRDGTPVNVRELTNFRETRKEIEAALREGESRGDGVVLHGWTLSRRAAATDPVAAPSARDRYDALAEALRARFRTDCLKQCYRGDVDSYCRARAEGAMWAFHPEVARAHKCQ